MTGPTLDSDVNQAYFAWRPDGGLSLVASSYLDSAQNEKWSHRLQKHLRIYPVPDTPLPSAGYSYHLFPDGSAAWIRRAMVGATAGRNNARALIGQADVLDFPTAIGLSLRPGWTDDPPAGGHTRPVSAVEVRGAIGSAEELMSRVHKHRDDVAVVLAGLLADPAGALTVIGGVEAERLVTIWALHRIAERYLPQRFRDRPDWSYSTYEDKHDSPPGSLPGIVFLPVSQRGANTVRRTIVDLAQPRVDPGHLAQAHDLVSCLLGERQPDGLIVDVPVVRPREKVYGAPAPAASPWQTGPQVVTPVAAPPRAAPARSLLANLLKARDVTSFEQELYKLEQHGMVLHPHADTATIDTLARFVEVNVRHELLKRLLDLLYGRSLAGDLHDAKAEKHAIALITRGQSDQLALMAGAAARPGSRIRDAAFDRLAAGAGKPPAELVGQLSSQLRAGRHSQWFPWAAAGVAAVTAALVFLLGFLYGRPDSTTAAPAVVVTVPSSAVATPPPPPEGDQASTDSRPPGGGPGQSDGDLPSVRVRADQGGTAWVFTKLTDDQFVPLTICQEPSGNEWTCTKQPPAGGEQVAIAIPADSDLTRWVGKPIPPRPGWGRPQTIR